jgi:hypothetical protein
METTSTEPYTSYRNLPPLAGLGSFAEAFKPGLSVEESVLRLKRHHYALKRLHGIFISRIASEPVYELKMAFSYHAHLCAEHVTALRSRVGEMREPPLGLDKVPEVILPRLLGALQRHIEAAHVLADQPSRRVCRLALFELEEVAAYGKSAVASLVGNGERKSATLFLDGLEAALDAARDLDGTGPEPKRAAKRLRSAVPFTYDKIPRRDGRFPDPYNMGVNAEALLYDEKKPNDAKVLMMYYKRLREIDVPEMMSSIIAETEGKPWGYYRDMTGEVGFVSLGLDWAKLVMVNFTWSHTLNSKLTAKERHAVLYYIEQGLMPKTGKRHEWEVALLAQDGLSATFQDFDWADEVLHARVGRDWYVTDMPSAPEAIKYGDQTWTKVMLDWRSFRDQGLTGHRNWWPDLYAAYCEKQGKQPDPATIAFAETYESRRADLKEVRPPME